MRRTLASILVALSNFLGPDAFADSHQSVSFYGGPATHKFVSQIVQGNFDVDGTLVGLAYDRGLVNLGAGFTLDAEVQVTHFFTNRSYSTAAGGLGVRYDTSRWTPQRSSFAFYTGPSYADDPIRHDGQSGRLLEYVAVELAVEINKSQWDGVIRMFHRSGAFGLYGNHTDTGSMLGIGIQRRF